MKWNIKKASKIKLSFFIVEVIILLVIGIYNLVKDTSIVVPSLIILIIGYLVSLLKHVISKVTLQKEIKFFKKKIIIKLIMYSFFIIISIFRKKILGNYFIGQQITMLTIWFLIGVIIENIIILGILIRKEN